MASLALQFAGSFVGGALFGPIGAKVGGLIGSYIGSQLFGPDQEDTTRFGPRLQELGVSSSAFGQPIPWVFGTQRVGTQMIWATDIIEIRTEITVEQGGGGGFGKGGIGGGGSSQTNVTFKYHANAALLCCRGEKDIVKIWADGKIILDHTGEGQVASAKFSGLIVRYNGSTTQEPDPTVQADVGIADTSAYRDICYFVIHDFPLEDFGNRIPQFNVLVSDASEELPSDDLDLLAIYGDFNTVTPAGISRGAWSIDGRYFIDILDGIVFDTLNHSVVTKTDRLVDQIGINGVGDNITVDKQTGNVVLFESTVSNTTQIYIVDPITLELLYAGTLTANNPFFTELVISQSATPPLAGELVNNRISVMDKSGTIYVYETRPSVPLDMVQLDDGSFVPELQLLMPGVQAINFLSPSSPGNSWDTLLDHGSNVDRDQFAWFAITDDQGVLQQDMYLFQFDPWAGAFVSATKVPNESGGGQRRGDLAYDPVLHKLAVFVSHGGGGNNVNYIQQYDIETDTWEEFGVAILGMVDSGTNWNGYHAINSKAWFQRSIAGIIKDEYDFATHSISGGINTQDWGSSGVIRAVQYDVLQNAIFAVSEGVVSVVHWYYLDRLSINGVTLKFVVDEISDEVGLDLTQVDTDALSADTVKGYAINRRMTARSAIEPLRGTYFFDATESDYVMSFVKRGGDPVLTLVDDDLGATNSLGDATGLVAETRSQEVELPLRIDFQYADENFEYQQGSQYAKRADEAVTTIDQVRMDVAIVFNATEAKNIAEVRLYLPWIERERKAMSTTWQHLALDPTDVVQITLDDGTSFEVYVFDIDTSVDGLLEVTGVLQRPETQTFRTTTVGQEAEGFDPSEIVVAGGSQFYVMDIPLLQDMDESQTPVLHTAAGRTVSIGSSTLAWLGARIDRSFDGIIFNAWTYHASASEATHGSVELALPSTSAPWVWDRTNTIVVRLAFGTLASATEAQVLDGANAAIVGKEIIQFASATLNADGTYTLSTLLRARRGTDLYARINNGVAHSIHERFVLLTTAAIQLRAHQTDNLNRAQDFRAVTTGSPGITTRTLTPVGQSKYPYAPYLVEATRDGSGDLTITWARRTRLGGAIDWITGPANPPLSEAFEQYNVSILDANGLEVRNIEVDDAETVVYTAAQSDTDFGTDLDPLTDTVDVVVYQISDDIGRGFPSELVTA